MTKTKRTLLIIGLVVVPLAGLGFLDYVTGWQTSLSFFYLIPIAFASLLAGRKGAVVCCFLASGVFLWDQWMAPPGHWVALWNATMRLGTLLVVGWLLPIATDDLKRVFRN